jgi:hypothetical protein
MTSSAPPTVCYALAKTFSPCRGARPHRRPDRGGGRDRLRDVRQDPRRDRQGLTITQIASTLGLHREAVAKWLARPRFERSRPPKRRSLLDPFKGRITRLLDTHPYSGQQIFQRLREEGYGSGISVLRDYVRLIRPPKLPVYLKLHFAAGGAYRRSPLRN